MKLLLSTGFSLATVTGFFLDKGMPFEEMTLPAFLAFLAATALLSVVVFLFTGLLLRRMPAVGARIITGAEGDSRVAEFPSAGEKKRSLLLWAGVTVLLMLCWLPAWLAFWPGLWNYDVPVVQQVLRGTYSNYNPLVNTLFLGLCHAFGKMIANENAGVILYTAIQMLVMAGIFGYALCYAGRFLRRGWMKLLLFLFYALFPLHAVMVLSPTKDVLFAGLFTLLTVWMLQLFFDEPGEDTAAKTALRVGTCVLVLLTRHNGLAGMLLLTAVVLLAQKRIPLPLRRKKLLLLSLGLWAVFSFALKTGLQAEAFPDAEVYSVSAQQFGRIHMYGNEEERRVVEEFFDFERSAYVPSISDSMKTGLKEGNRGAFLLQSAKWAIRHPLLTLDAWLYLTKGQWDIDDRTHTEQYRAMNPENRQGYLATDIYGGFGVERNSLLPAAEEWYTGMFTENKLFDIPVVRNIFTPAFWHWLFLFCALALVTYAPKSRSVYLLFPCGILLSLLFGPCALIRYSYLFVTCTPLLLVFAFVFAGMAGKAAA